MADGPGGVSGEWEPGDERPATVTPGRHVGRYEIIKQVGRGGMAIVYLARQETLDREVALKELSTFQATSQDVAQRFLRESRLAGSLNHPNIVTVYEYLEDGGIPYIAMEYLARGSLRPYVGRLTLAQVAGLMEGVLSGLAHAEMLGIVHRDLKPENLLATSDGRVKITDFGIAKATQSAGAAAFLTATGTTVGTPAYMAPEQAMAQDVGIWTDLYSVGVMAWEHLVGRVPFHDSQAPLVVLMHQINDQVPSAASVNHSVDREVSDWIGRLLVKDPRERTNSAISAWEELEEIIINQLGARWRRDARLPSCTAVLDTARPLAPAPFESQRPFTSRPVSRLQKEGRRSESAYLTFEPAVKALSPRPSEPPAPSEESVERTAEPDSGGSLRPVPEAAADLGPAAQPEDVTPIEAPEPPAAAATPAYLNVDPPTTRSEYGPEAAEADPACEPVIDKPALVSTAPPPVGRPDEVAVAVADLAAPSQKLAIPSPGVATPAPEDVSGIRESTAADTTREPSTHPASMSRGASRRLPLLPDASALAVGGIILSAIAGFLIAPPSTRSARGPARLSQTATSKLFKVSFPAGWVLRRVPTTGEFALADVVALGPAERSKGLFIVGAARPGDPSLLPRSLHVATTSGAQRQVVKLGDAQFYRYVDTLPSGASVPENVYAIPTTVGAVIGVCSVGRASVEVASGCERILGTLRMSAGAVLRLGPSQALARTLTAVIDALNTSATRAHARLVSASKSREEAAAATDVAAAYGRAASSVASLQTSPQTTSAIARLVMALRSGERAYTALAAAAAHDDHAGYDAARASVPTAAAAINDAFQYLARLGYVRQ